MYKQKTKKAVKKKFKITASGKLKKSKPGKRHILTKKSSNRKRHLERKTVVSKGIAKVYLKTI